MTQRSQDLDHLAHLERESARFAEALRGTESAAPVPTCPDWDAEDLLWHLAEVQWFWGEIVRRGITDLSQVEAMPDPERPETRDALERFFAEHSAGLHRALAAAEPATTVWTWSTEQTAGWIRRRQAHEALVHRLDAELTAGDRTPLDPALSADGVDEALRVMYGGQPPSVTFTAQPGGTLRLRATDTGHSWLVTLGRSTGPDPDGAQQDEPDIRTAAQDPGGAAAATVSGTAEDLDCWLWHRPTAGELERAGDEAVVAGFERVIAGGVQ